MEKLLYHQKLLDIFTQEELDKIINCSIYSKDEGCDSGKNCHVRYK